MASDPRRFLGAYSAGGGDRGVRADGQPDQRAGEQPYRRVRVTADMIALVA